MSLAPRSHRFIVYNWSYGALQCLLYAGISRWTQFSGDISTIFGPILKKCVTVEFSEIFYIGHDEWNEFLESEIFSGSVFPHLRFLISDGMSPSKGTPSDCTLSISTIGLQ